MHTVASYTHMQALGSAQKSKSYLVPDGFHTFPSSPLELPEVDITIGMPHQQNAALQQVQ